MENVPTEPQARIDLVWKGGLRGAATPAVSVPVRPALLGIGFLFAFLMGVVGLAGIQREPDLAPFVDALCWGALGVCLLEACLLYTSLGRPRGARVLYQLGMRPSRTICGAI